MEVRCDAMLAFPRALVWTAYRDKLPELVPYLPNIRGIDIIKREEEPGIVRFENIWHGGGDIPALARTFLSESMLSWTDLATWREAEYATEWRVETHSFREAVRSQGTNRYFETAGGTRLEIRGDLAIDGTRLKGVPRLLAGKVARAVEEFMVTQVAKNLLDVSKGVERYLKEAR